MKFSCLSVVLIGIILSIGGCANNAAEETKSAPQPAVAPATAPTPTSVPASPTASAESPVTNNATKAAPIPDKPAAPAPVKFTVPAGTRLTVILIDAVGSDKNKAGDEFTASLAEPVIVHGQSVIPKGAKVHGRIVDAEGSGRVKGVAKMRMILTGIMDGPKLIPIVTKAFVAQAQTTKGRDAAVAGGGAGVGAAVGAIAGGKKGAGLGALIGGVAGTGAVLATKGKEVEFPSESRLKFTLDKAVEVPVIRR
jgi:hypothetical protein